jgi:hypothetical protein
MLMRALPLLVHLAVVPLSKTHPPHYLCASNHCKDDFSGLTTSQPCQWWNQQNFKQVNMYSNFKHPNHNKNRANPPSLGLLMMTKKVPPLMTAWWKTELLLILIYIDVMLSYHTPPCNHNRSSCDPRSLVELAWVNISFQVHFGCC